MKWFHWAFVILVVLLMIAVVTMQVKADIAIWNSDVPFLVKWKLLFGR